MMIPAQRKNQFAQFQYLSDSCNEKFEIRDGEKRWPRCTRTDFLYFHPNFWPFRFSGFPGSKCLARCTILRVMNRRPVSKNGSVKDVWFNTKTWMYLELVGVSKFLIYIGLDCDFKLLQVSPLRVNFFLVLMHGTFLAQQRITQFTH